MKENNLILLGGCALAFIILYFGTGAKIFCFLFAFFTLLLIFFFLSFRDPEREVVKNDRVLLSPADGKVIDVRKDRISIFMRLFDVHVVRSPCKGKVVAIKRIKGSHFPAFLNETDRKNERVTIFIECDGGQITLNMIAGMLARTVISYVRVGDIVEQGEKIGMIVLGSRVDMIFPDIWVLSIQRGKKVRGGLSIIARKRGRNV